MTAAALPTIDELLATHGLPALPEEPFPNDGWSGASLTLIRGPDGRRFILKRDSPDRDWIARATGDGPVLREAWFAGFGPELPAAIRNPAIGGAYDAPSGESAVLMPDLTGILFDWSAVLAEKQLDVVLDALAALHAFPWSASAVLPADPPWCPLPERISLIARTSLERAGPARDAVADRLLPGWDAFDRLASPAARDIIAELAADPTPLVRALEARPRTLIHSDLKLANVGIAPDGAVDVVDWQMVMFGPIAIELGWFLASNVNALPLSAASVIDRYRQRLDRARRDAEDRGRHSPLLTAEDEDVDLAILVGLLLRGWRKGFDVEAGVTLGSGVAAADDLAWWCERAVAAAGRSL